MTALRGQLLGYLEAVAAASLWGSSGIFAVYLFRMGVPPESLALLRPLVGGAVLLLAVAAFKGPRSLGVDVGGLAVLVLGGGVTIGIFQVAYQLSTDAVGVPSTVALLYLAPAVVAAASGPLLGEWPDRTRIALLVVTLSGIWISVLGAHEVASTFGNRGVGWGVLAGVSYGGYTLFGRFAAPRYGALRTVVYTTLGSVAFLALVLPVASGPVVWPSSAGAWLLLLAFSILTIAAAHFLFFDALARIDASRASIATAVEPVVAGVLATLLLSQGLSAVGWLGIALVAAGVAGVGVTARRGRATTPPALGSAEGSARGAEGSAGSG
ncbi:MAG: DMT family transporter [Longimicrobiales bacterium]|nr:DMT family transporter [Longimicrobiales bacterium]